MAQLQAILVALGALLRALALDEEQLADEVDDLSAGFGEGLFDLDELPADVALIRSAG